MSKVGRVIERSSLGTSKAQAARRSVPRANAARIVAASTKVRTSRDVGGKR